MCAWLGMAICNSCVSCMSVDVMPSPPLLRLLLQPSLTGSGAKIAIICNVTPASSQSDETWNTLRFADGAKRIKVSLCTGCRQHACLPLVCLPVPGPVSCLHVLINGSGHNTSRCSQQLQMMTIPSSPHIWSRWICHVSSVLHAYCTFACVQVAAVKNEVLDLAAVVAQYQREVAQLKAQLAALSGEFLT